MKPRLFGAAAALTLTSLVGATAVATAAGAAPPQASAAAVPAAPSKGSLSTSIPCSGVASTCTLTITRFRVVGGTIVAVGTVTGGGVTIPFQTPVKANVSSPVRANAMSPLQANATCGILDLTLGPLHLDLLGLVVDLNQVHLTITAEQGSGNLLGNLLCAVAGLLDNNPTGGLLQAITNLLNQILGAL